MITEGQYIIAQATVKAYEQQLGLYGISQQRELLLAFCKGLYYKGTRVLTDEGIDQSINEFLKANNCG